MCPSQDLPYKQQDFAETNLIYPFISILVGWTVHELGKMWTLTSEAKGTRNKLQRNFLRIFPNFHGKRPASSASVNKLCKDEALSKPWMPLTKKRPPVLMWRERKHVEERVEMTPIQSCTMHQIEQFISHDFRAMKMKKKQTQKAFLEHIVFEL